MVLYAPASVPGQVLVRAVANAATRYAPAAGEELDFPEYDCAPLGKVSSYADLKVACAPKRDRKTFPTYTCVVDDTNEEGFPEVSCIATKIGHKKLASDSDVEKLREK